MKKKKSKNKCVPELLADSTVPVVPTSTPMGLYFALRYILDPKNLDVPFKHIDECTVDADGIHPVRRQSYK